MILSVSECAFAVLGEIPSRVAISAFEHPSAISRTTSRCLAVKCPRSTPNMDRMVAAKRNARYWQNGLFRAVNRLV
ncbi:MAG: hypothetical protein M3304_03615 [Actinomycetota bacterium]|nr:hypothetical protein [Actinomycetota bacterium]